MPESSIQCPNCRYRLATIDLPLPQRPSVDSGTDRPLLLRVTDAARRLDISRTSLYELIAKGELSVVRIGRSIRIPWRELERMSEG